jgi:hypothetical protein
MAFSYKTTESDGVLIYPNATKTAPAIIRQPAKPNGDTWANSSEAAKWAEDWISAYKETSRPFDSWIWADEKNTWEPPIAHPENDKLYDWDETSLSWIEVTDDSD